MCATLYICPFNHTNMQKLQFVITTLSLLLIACSGGAKPETTTVAEVPGQVVNKNVGLNNLFTLADAQRILGEPATTTDSLLTGQANIKAFKGTYSGKENGDKTGVVYFLVEQYNREVDAVTKYGFIKASNEGKPGYEELKGVGTEGYFHSDNENFHFIMVRKSTSVMNIKVRITPTTSLDAFKEIAGRIVDQL